MTINEISARLKDSMPFLYAERVQTYKESLISISFNYFVSNKI